jgi:hypothetical protein
VTEFPVLRGRGPDRPAEKTGEELVAEAVTGSVYDAHGNNEWILKLLELLKTLWIKRPDFRFLGGLSLHPEADGGRLRPCQSDCVKSGQRSRAPSTCMMPMGTTSGS